MISILILHVHIVATMNGGQLAPPTTRYAICYTCVSIALATACNTDTFTTLTTLVVTLRFTWRLRFRKCSCTIWKQLFTITRRRLVVWLFAYDQVAINRFAALCCIHTFIWHSYNEKSFFLRERLRTYIVEITLEHGTFNFPGQVARHSWRQC